jgi:hypothetical protein
MRMTASWSGSERTYRIQVCGAMFRARWRVPLGSLRRHVTGAVRRRSFEEKPVSLFIVPPCAQASRRCENTSDAAAASRQAALAFRSLDPLRALRDTWSQATGRRTAFPAPNKELSAKPKNNQRIDCPATGEKPLDRKSPLQVWCEPDLRGRTPIEDRLSVVVVILAVRGVGSIEEIVRFVVPGDTASGSVGVLWYLGATLFLVFNVMEVIKGLIRGQVVLRAVIGCVLPFVIAQSNRRVKRCRGADVRQASQLGRSRPRPQAVALPMRLRFGVPIGDGRPVGHPPDAGEESRFGNIFAGCSRAFITAAVRLPTALDGALGAHPVHEADQGREEVLRPRADPPQTDGLLADDPCHSIGDVGDRPIYDFG